MSHSTPPAETPAVPDTQAVFDRRHEHWVLASMLLVLHAALDAGLDSRLSSALMTAHLGLFFLWQPIWQKEQRLRFRAVAVIVMLVVAIVASLSWWSVFAWLMVLIGIVAGRSFSTRRERYVYMVSLAFLISEFLVTCTSMLFFGGGLTPGITSIFQIGLYVLPAALFAIPSITVPQRDPFAVDFFRGITFALMTALLAVFSVLMTFRLNIEYPTALVATLMALGLLLFFLSWMTTPGPGNIGLLAVWEKSVLNIGTPFETWLGNIANLGAQSVHADDFLEAAIEELNDIPWVSGVEWRTNHANGIVGKRSHHHLAVDAGALEVSLFTERSFSSALLIHCRLLIQVLGHFYAAKQRENEEANEAHLRAIYETGARVTHDIKNLLQSLNTLAGSLRAANTAEQEHRGFNLIKRRLPDIAHRLQLALDKLQRPEMAAPESIDAYSWWADFSRRIGDGPIDFDAVFDDPGALLPAECFDSVIDNLLDNANHKISAGNAARVHVRLHANSEGVSCTVSDDGKAIAQAVERELFRGPVDSNTGLGIGLYQAARHAQLNGCNIRLTENRDGAVTFAIYCPAAAAGAAE